MPSRRLVLASASPARLRLLTEAGLSPEVVVSGVDESGVVGAAAEQVLQLARRKAQAVAIGQPDALVIGCDSLLDFQGEAYGKPGGPAAAAARWRSLRGQAGTLVTGHCVIDTAQDRSVSAVAATVVRFGTPTDREIDAYVASGEPLRVAGAFTLDGRSGAFVEGIDGDHGNVLGLSLPLLRSLLQQLDVGLVDLWS